MPNRGDGRRRRPVQARSQATVDAVLDAAARLAEARGADALTADAIASGAGVAVGTLYQYFDGIDAVREALLTRYLAEFAVVMRHACTGRAFTSRTEAALAVIDAYIDYYRTAPGFRALWFGTRPPQGHRALDQANNELLAATMADILLEHRLIPTRTVDVERQILITWTVGDALIDLAFRIDPEGDETVLAALREVVAQRSAKPLP